MTSTTRGMMDRRRGPDNPDAASDGQTNTTNITTTPAPRERHTNSHNNASNSSSSRPTRHFKPMSNYNVFQTSCAVATDAPPSYATALRPRPSSPPRQVPGREKLPAYSCTVECGAKMLLNLECVNPLSFVGETDWREVYALVRGTMLSLHRVKDGGPGKLLRTYTLQHAEVGLATDVEFCKLVPQTRMAHLIPGAARRRAWQKDASLFKEVRQSVLRLRAEAHQLLLADSDESRVWQFVHSLSAAIDIAQPIDDRSIPRQCTVPRRRNRRHQQHQQQQQRPHFGIDINDPIMLAEQERIFSQMFPRFAQTMGAQEQTVPQIEEPVEPVEVPQTPAREEEEIDLSEMREDSSARPQSNDGALRPGASRTTTSTTVNSTFSDDMMYVTSPANFTPEGKWQPAQTRTEAQLQRYIRRCMPVLLCEAPRASDIIICNGKRMRINARMELLEEWELQPPSYKAHNFHKSTAPHSTTDLARSSSQRSSAAGEAPQSSSSVLDDADQITHVESDPEPHQRLSKITTASSTMADKSAPSRATLRAMADADPKGRSPAQLAQDINLQGVVLCF